MGLCFKAEGNAPSLSGRSDERCPNRVRLPDPIKISSRSCRIHAEDGAAVAIEEGRHAVIGDAVHVHRTVTRLVECRAERIEVALGRILEIDWNMHVGHAEGVHSRRLVSERLLMTM
jgi:hypothetical protein